MSAAARIRVVVGEDQPLVREGIVRVLEEAGFEVLGVASDAEDLVRKARAHKPNVVITDIQMPPDSTDDGLRAAVQIRTEQPDVGVLVLSQFLEERFALDLVGDHAEGVGYLLKDRVGDLGMFTDAVRRVARGGSALDPDVVQRMVGRKRGSSPIDDLTPPGARGNGLDGRRTIKPWNRGRAGRDRAGRRTACDKHLRKAWLKAGVGRSQAGACRARVPQAVTDRRTRQ